MEKLEFIPVETAEQIETVRALAVESWNTCYIAGYGSVKVEYLLQTFLSPERIRRQIDAGTREYLLICYGGAYVGYLAVQEEGDALWVYHAYILERFQGNRTIAGTLEYLEERCAARGLGRLKVVVDGNNTRSLAYCERLGLCRCGGRMHRLGSGWSVALHILEKEIKK